MNKKRLLAAILGLIFSGLFIACGDANDPGTAPDQTSKPTLQSVSSRTVIPNVTAWASVSAGMDFTCGIDSALYLYCWGRNEYGTLGVGDTADRKTASLLSTSPVWASVSAGGYFACAQTIGGYLYCWGDNNNGSVGDGTTADRLQPTEVVNTPDWLSLDTGFLHACALRDDYTLWCWGQNGYGQIGNGGFSNATAGPVQLAKTWKTMSVGGYHTCAIRKKDNTLWCWGQNDEGELGIGTLKNKNVPTKVGTSSNWALVQCGGYHTCAKKKDGTIWCFGRNQEGQIGNGKFSNTVKSPVKVGKATNWASLSNGNFHSCAMKKNTGLYCWGWNGGGQLATGDTVDRKRPRLVNGAGTGYLLYSAGGAHTCGLWSDSQIWCWGANWAGQLGNGNTVDQTFPSQVVNP